MCAFHIFQYFSVTLQALDLISGSSAVTIERRIIQASPLLQFRILHLVTRKSEHLKQNEPNPSTCFEILFLSPGHLSYL